MSDREHAAMLIKMAYKDFKAIQGMLDRNIFDDEIFGFHAQQSIEKALKSLISFNEIIYPKTHDIEELFAILGKNHIQIPEKFSKLAELTYFAVQYRYESFADFDGDIDRNDILENVNNLISYVEKIINI